MNSSTFSMIAAMLCAFGFAYVPVLIGKILRLDDPDPDDD
jgi:hypothetical protein